MTKELKTLYNINPKVGDTVYCYNRKYNGLACKVDKNWRIWCAAAEKYWSTIDYNKERKTELADTPTAGKWSDWMINNGTSPADTHGADVMVDYIMALESVQDHRQNKPRTELASHLSWKIEGQSHDIVMYRIQPVPDVKVAEFWFDGKTFSGSRRAKDFWQLKVTLENGKPVLESVSLTEEK